PAQRREVERGEVEAGGVLAVRPEGGEQGADVGEVGAHRVVRQAALQVEVTPEGVEERVDVVHALTVTRRGGEGKPHRRDASRDYRMEPWASMTYFFAAPLSNSSYPRGASSRLMTSALTALAMWILSLRIACMRPRWYVITGVWPVTKVSAFAQPVPKSIDRAPRWAASSTPPGSPVT